MLRPTDTHVEHVLSSLADLCHATDQPWHVKSVQGEIGGGRVSPEDLTALDGHPHAVALTISGLDQTAFEALVERHAAQFSALHFWKCPRIADLSPLEHLPHLTHVAFYWNQRASRLWNFARTPKLDGLQFRDFTRLHDLSDLREAISLRELTFGDAIWPKSTFQSLEPIGALQSLKRLKFDAKRIDDGRVQPLAKLQQLEELEFPPNMLTTRQVAWLRARLPESVHSTTLTPIRVLQGFKSGSSKDLDRLVIGKRKPFLNSESDAGRIEEYERQFWRMVDQFRKDSNAQPDE